MGRTTRIPLTSAPASPVPAFVQSSQNSRHDFERVVSAVVKAKRVVVLCGAGVSVDAGIPDFRSSDGLFNTLRRDNSRHKLSSGQDLFHANVFNSPETTKLFNTMIGTLAKKASSSQPTAFHQVLKSLDDRGRLLRVYTQNIDGLEEQAGLSYGVPAWGERPKRSSKSTPKRTRVQEVAGSDLGLLTPPSSYRSGTPPAHDSSPSPSSNASCTSEVPPASLIPRCIPLHGHVKTLYCQRCSHTTALGPYVESLSSGSMVPCSSCEALESTRRLVGKRGRGVGNLRPSVVLYGETHLEGEVVGECVRRDLLGIQGKPWISLSDDMVSGKGKVKEGSPRPRASNTPDLLIVAGTSLKIPGTKRIVREFSKALKARSAKKTAGSGDDSDISDDDTSIRTIFVNLDFPVPARDWEGVFDVWAQGDIQLFANAVSGGLKRQDCGLAVRVVTSPEDQRFIRTPPSTPPSAASHKRKMTSAEPGRAPKRQRHNLEHSTSALPGSRPPLPHLAPSTPNSSPNTSKKHTTIKSIRLKLPPNLHSLPHTPVEVVVPTKRPSATAAYPPSLLSPSPTPIASPPFASSPTLALRTLTESVSVPAMSLPS
ncbi:hypothetical protein FRB99_005848 [Tulasnella sp. 403]|nr:hypothetical protein FRB99_005848 [Tulasnella sp. 403]